MWEKKMFAGEGICPPIPSSDKQIVSRDKGLKNI